MSRIGNQPINVPDKVQVEYNEPSLKVKGPKGELTIDIPEGIELKIDGNEINISRTSDDSNTRSMHGLTRSLAANAVEGISTGFTKTLLIEGVGFRAEMKGNRLFLSMGFSHPILILPPDGITFATPNATTIQVSGIDKQLLGEVAARIRKIRPPEPYKGKGIRYEGEYVRRKAGKTAA